MMEVLRKESREWGWGLKLVMDLADIKIMNDGTPEDFEESINRELSNIGVY